MQANSRREVMALMGAAALAGGAGPARAAATPVIEWNMHMFSANVAKFPFHPNAAYKPDAATLPPDPLPPYSLSFWDYLMGYSLWVVIAGAILWTLISGAFKRRRAATLATAAPQPTAPPSTPVSGPPAA